MKRTPMKRASSLRRVSPGRARQNRAYSVLRAEFLEAHPWCEFPAGCGKPSEVVHHTRGRRGGRLLDTAWWKAACGPHNDFAEERTGEALELGWLHRIEGAA